MTTNILDKNNGANFYLADMHIHTPLDKNFKCPKRVDPNTPAGKASIAKGYIEAAKKKNIRIIGITEHNDVSWIDPIREAAKGTGIVIFPGIELSADSGAGGIHIIALFNPDRDVTDLDDIITQLGLPRKDRFHSDGSPKLSNKQLCDLVDFIDKKGGLCIAAHVLREHGILKPESMRGELRVSAWKNLKLLAAEIPNSRSELSGFGKQIFDNNHDLYKRERPIAAIYSSDARSFDEIGSRAMYIKISSMTLEGLKQAFLDWESRIRHPNEICTQTYSRILSAKWEGGFLDGLKIHFNDNLNCLIGGKGTGKSTILETVRFAFGDEIAPNAEKAAEQHTEILENVFKRGSKVTLLVEAHSPVPKRYIIERSYNDPPVVKDEHGALIPALKPTDVFYIEAYGQKEIYEISKDPRFQLALVDRFLGNKLDELNEQEKELQLQINTHTTDYLKLKQEIELLTEQISKLPKLEEQLKRYQQSEMPQRLKEKSKYEEERTLLSGTVDSITKVKTSIEKTKTVTFLPDNLPDDLTLNNFPNKDLLVQIKQLIKTANESIKKSLFEISSTISGVEKNVIGKDGFINKWKKNYEAQEERYKALLRELQKEFPGIDINTFLKTEIEINRLKPLKSTLEYKKIELDEIQKQRSQFLNKLYDNLREQFSMRDRTCQEISRALDGILKISVEHEGDRKLFLDRLKELKSGVQQQQLEQIVNNTNFSIPTFIQAVRQGHQKVVEVFGVTDATASRLCQSLNEEVLLKMESFKIGTKTTIELNVGTKESHRYQNTRNLSVGQKCTAILTLILLESSVPLIIDQPEDDLDNTFIFSDIVKKLRKEKERRQFIIATHNANIPVLGDAELMCVLTADADHGRIEEGNYGSIDDKPVRKPVEEILEGGREAFQLRREKYGF